MKTNTTIKMKPETSGNLTPLRKHHFSLSALTSMPWSLLRALPAIGVGLWTAASALAQTTYTLTQISPPSGATSSSVESVNNHGQVVGNTKVKVGRSNIPGPAFVWANGVALSLPSLGADPAAQANGISDSGLIVGHSPSLYVYDPNSPPKAVWWQLSSGQYQVGDWNTLLPANSRLFLAAAISISEDGQFVVFDAKDKDSGRYYPVVARIGSGGMSMTTWTINYSPALEPLYDGYGSDIHSNETALRVVGYYAKTETDIAHPFLWEMNLNSLVVTMRDLDEPNLNRYGFTEGVNGAGEIVGDINISGIYQAHFWNAFGVKQQLPTLGGARSISSSINDNGLVTGLSSRSGKNVLHHAFLWDSKTGAISDLNALKSPTDTSGIELTNGRNINDAGQILAFGLRKGVGHNVLLNPLSP